MMAILFYRIKDMIFHIGDEWDKKALNEATAIDFAHKHINAEPKRKTDIHNYSLEYCLASSGETINEHFRNNQTQEIHKKISDMVSSHKTDKDIILYRGICDSVLGLMKKNAQEIADCDLYEKGFLSCSLVKGHEINSKIKLRIYIPAGTKCVYMGNVNDEQYYYEVDVMHGSKLKIESIDSEYINCKLLETG